MELGFCFMTGGTRSGGSNGPEKVTSVIGVGEALCTKREVVAVVDRPQDIEDLEAMALFCGEEGDADESQG